MSAPGQTATGDYRALLRSHVATHGTPVSPNPSPYNGWDDYEAAVHAGPRQAYSPGVTCRWVVPEGALLSENTVVEWGGTFGEETREYVVDVAGADCTCGMYTGVTLRLVSTFGDVLRAALGEEGAIPL